MANPTEAEMMSDLAAADAAGDTQLAQAIAARIKAARAPTAPQTVASHTPGAAVQPDIKAQDLVTGPVEGAMTIGSGMLAYPAGLAAGAASLALGRGKEPLDFDAAREWRQKVQGGLTYTPRTASGQGFVSATDRLLRPWTDTARYVGRKVGDATGSPTAGGAAEEVFGAVVNPVTLALGMRGLQRTQTTLPPRLRVTPESKVLTREGVPLTVGQQVPESTIGILERMSADSPWGMRRERDAAKEGFVRAAQNKGVAPGAVAPATSDLQARLGEMFKQYGPVYDQFKNQQVAPDVLEGLRSASSMPSRGVDARTAAAAKGEIENALSVLGPKPQAPAPSGLLGPNGKPLPSPSAPTMTASVGDLMKARENVRESLRSAVKSEDYDRIRLLKAAEEEFTGAIESALPRQQRALLQDTDRQYARLMTAATAAPSGQTVFTPGQYLRRVEKSSGARNFKTGKAGDLQDLGEAARTALADAPATGMRVAALSSLPLSSKWGAPVARWANTPSGRRFLLDPRTRYGLTGSPDPMAAALAEAMSSAPASSLLGLPKLKFDPYLPVPADEGQARRRTGGGQ